MIHEEIAKKVGKSRVRVKNTYKIINLILKCLAGETLISETIQKGHKKFSGLSRATLKDLVYIDNREYFHETLSLAKSGTTRGKLRRFIEKKSKKENPKKLTF